MKKSSTRLLAFAGILVVVVVIALYRLGFFSGESEKNKIAEAEPAAAKAPARGNSSGPLPVSAMLIQPTSVIDFISVNGSTEPDEEVTVSSEVPGKVLKILFKEGTRVSRGTPLVKLDDTELQAQRERLVVQQNLNQKIAERLQALYEREGVSLQEYEVAKAEVEKVKAEISLIDAQLDKRTIRAPFSGVLGLRMVSEGSYLSPGTPIVNLVSINPIDIQFAVPEKYSSAVGPGTEVTFRLDGSAKDFKAKVIAAEPVIDAATRTFLLKATAPNPNGSILPGAFANVTVNLQEFTSSIMVPTEAVIPELGGKKVFVARGGIAQPVEVETGIRQEASIQVISGLAAGDTLITSGILQLRAGSPVDINLGTD
ncbi:MAG: efflux RND transporter periplasmic adaptor subunit [Saprospiraceae bacterium]|nr:efflux RND transporter periplasmic adaptor subunit [Lewinella sp.]